MNETIDWLGHATVRLELDGVRILTDPTIRERIGPLDRKVAPIAHHEVESIDLVLISHLHLDHLDLPSLRRLGDVRLIVPAGSGPIFRAAGHRDVDEFSPGDRTTHGPLAIEIVRADHSGFRPPFGPTGPALGFVISSSRRRIYFAGDTDLYPEMADIPDLDVALVPVWGWGPNLAAGTWTRRWRPTPWPCSDHGSPSRSTGARSGRRRWGSSGRIGCSCRQGVRARRREKRPGVRATAVAPGGRIVLPR